MCRQAEVRRHDGLRAEGRSPYVRLRDSLRTAEKKLWGRKKSWGVEKVIWPPNTITTRRRKRKEKKSEVFPLGRRKIDFRAPKEQGPKYERSYCAALRDITILNSARDRRIYFPRHHNSGAFLS